MAVLPLQMTIDRAAAVVLHGGEEVGVHRQQAHDCLARLCKGPDGSADGIHHTGGSHQPVLLRLPAEAALKPASHGGVVSRTGHGIAVNTRIRHPEKRLAHALRGGKIHIRHPQRQRIRAKARVLQRVIFDGAGTSAVVDLIKSRHRKLLYMRVLL